MLDPMLHTLNNIDCPACHAMVSTSAVDPGLPFAIAVQLWLTNHCSYIRPATARIYRQYAKELTKFFGELPLADMHVGHVRAYQHHRAKTCGPHRINSEVTAVLGPVLKEARLWHRIHDVYRPLPVPKRQVRKNMSEEQERRLLAVALDPSKPRRLAAGHCLIVMANTGMGFGEMRHLRMNAVVLNADPPYIMVNEGCKNDYRIRTIPLNWLALRSMRWLLHRCEDLGGQRPTDYILPHYATQGYGARFDFTRPMEGIYTAARKILRQAGLPDTVIYDMRSHFGTKMLSDPTVSDQMFGEIFGHSDTITRRVYSKQRMEKKAAATTNLCIAQEPTVRLISFPGGKK